MRSSDSLMAAATSGPPSAIVKRPYITVGFTALLCLLALAITSTKGSIRRLGKKWIVLHRLVYVAGVLAVLHFYWKRSAKNDVYDPLVFAVILLMLIAVRVPAWRERWLRRRS